MTGRKFVPSIKNTVREICISSCEGKYPGRDNGKLVSFKSQKGRFGLLVQWKQYKTQSMSKGYFQARASLRT